MENNGNEEGAVFNDAEIRANESEIEDEREGFNENEVEDNGEEIDDDEVIDNDNGDEIGRFNEEEEFRENDIEEEGHIINNEEAERMNNINEFGNMANIVIHISVSIFNEAIHAKIVINRKNINHIH